MVLLAFVLLAVGMHAMALGGVVRALAELPAVPRRVLPLVLRSMHVRILALLLPVLWLLAVGRGESVAHLLVHMHALLPPALFLVVVISLIDGGSPCVVRHRALCN